METLSGIALEVEDAGGKKPPCSSFIRKTISSSRGRSSSALERIGA